MLAMLKLSTTIECTIFMKDLIKKYLKIINDNGTIITIAAGVVPLMVALIMAMYFSRGNMALANYLIQEVGIFQIWSSALVLVAFSLLQVALVLLVFSTERQQQLEKYVGGVGRTLVIALSFVIVPLITFLGPVIGNLFGWMTIKFTPKLAKKIATNAQANYRKMYIVIATVVLYLGIIAYPLIPPSELTLKDNKKQTVIVLSHKDNGYLVMDTKTRGLSKIQQEDVTNEKICESKSSAIWYLGTLVSVINHLSHHDILPVCED